MRIKVIRLITYALFGLIAATLFYVQAVKGRHYRNLSLNNRIRVVPLDGWRGRIMDRNGVVMADNRKSYDVMVLPQEVKSLPEVLEYASRVLGVSAEELARRYRQKKINPFTPVAIAEDVTQEQAIVLEEGKYLHPSLSVEESFRRYYPLGENSAHVLGYVGKMNRSQIQRFKEYGYSLQSVIGYSGVEEYYDSYLKGEEGGEQIEVNSQGKQVRLLGLKEPTTGVDISLTVDSRVQQMAMELLGERRGVVIVMDAKNGEILTLASAPTFNPNVFVNNRLKDRSGSLFSDPYSPLLNRAIYGTFPPGSVFKVIMSIGAVEARKINQNTTFHCNGSYNLGAARFGCTHQHGSQNLIEAIAHSCNVYFYHVGLLLGESTISRYARLLGLGSPTHIDLPYEKQGVVPSRIQRRVSGQGPWYAGDTLNISIGQGDLLTTPLQLVKVMATIANDGIEVQPHLIRTIGGQVDGRFNFSRSVNIHKDALDSVKRGMRATVTDFSGTANALNIQGLYVAGKTGTAQSSKGKEDHAWFVGYVENDQKRLALCVFLEHGGSSQNANVIAHQLLTRMKSEQML